MDSDLIYALKVSGVGIVVLLLVLVLFAGVVSLMTKFIVDKPNKETEAEEAETEKTISSTPVKESNLATIAVIALALYRAQTEVQSTETTAPSGEFNSWRQFNLQRRLTQSSTIRRSR